MAHKNKAATKDPVRKAIQEIDEAAEELESGEDGEDDQPQNTSLVAKALETLGKALLGKSYSHSGNSDDTEALVDPDRTDGFGDPKDSKGAKRKNKPASHEGMEPTDQEEGDRDDDAADGSSEVTGSGPDSNAPNPVKRRRHIDLPDAFETGFKSRRAKGETDDDAIDKSERVATGMFEELADDENFQEVIEASPAMEHLTDVIVKAIARIETRQIRLEQAINKSLRGQAALVKSFTGNEDADGDDDSEGDDENAERRITKSNRGSGPVRSTSPGIIAMVDGKPVHVAMPEGMPNFRKSKGVENNPDFVNETREKLIDGMNDGSVDPGVLAAFDAHGFGVLEQQLTSDVRKSLGINLPN